MNVSIQAAELKRLVKKLSAVQSQNTELGNGYAFCTDGDTGILVKAPFEDVVIVNSRLFSATCNKLSGTVTLSKSGGPLVVKAGKFKAELPVLNQPPSALQPSSLSELEIPTKTLIELLTYASMVTTDKNNFDYSSAIKLEAYSGRMDATATDGLRIAQIAVGKQEASFGAIQIPSKIVKAIKDLDGERTTIHQTEASIVIRSGDTAIYTRKLTKKFPDVNRVIPTSYKLEVEIGVQELIEALQRVSSTVDPESNSKVLLSFEGDKLRLQTGNSELGQSEDEIPVNQIVPDPFDDQWHVKLAASSQWLLSYLTSVKGCDKILLLANESSKPFLLKAGGKSLLMAGIRI